MSYHDLAFDSMGCEVRLLIGDPLPGSPPAAEAAAREKVFIELFDAALSRFKPDSELTAFNEDAREVVPASPLLRQAIHAGLWAARRSRGLVDPTLGGEIVSAGYRESRAGLAPEPLADALSGAPARHPRVPPGGRVAFDRGRRPGRDGAPSSRSRLRHRRQRQGPGRGPGRGAAARLFALRGRLRRRCPHRGLCSAARPLRRPRPPSDRR